MNVTVFDLKSEQEVREFQNGGEKEGKEIENWQNSIENQAAFQKAS